MAQSVDPSATSTPNLFPTTTAGRGDPGTGGPGSANVYYLVVCSSFTLYCAWTDHSFLVFSLLS
jgi:hypothetical protein